MEARRDPAASTGAIKQIVDQLGSIQRPCGPGATRAEIDVADRPGSTSSDAERIVQLEWENREVRRAKAILKSTPAFFTAGLDRPSVRRLYRRPASTSSGAESICAVLTAAGTKIAPSATTPPDPARPRCGRSATSRSPAGSGKFTRRTTGCTTSARSTPSWLVRTGGWPSGRPLTVAPA
jgi:transposase